MKRRTKERLLKFFRQFWFIIPFAIYASGALLIEKTDISFLKARGYAEQEEYTYYDREGEEREGITLIRIKGLGKVLTYSDVYLSSVVLFVLFPLMGRCIFGNNNESVGDTKSVIFGNCVLGVLLVSLTTKGNILPTCLFWVGIIVSGICYEQFK